jgi:hypothetical protein
LCKRVTYEISGHFLFAGHCHCSMCRTSNGAAFATWGIINPDQFRWTSGEEWVERYKSSPERERCFCKRCGSALVASHSGEITEVVLGTVDADPGIRPREHIFVDSKAPWFEIADALPQHKDWPP